MLPGCVRDQRHNACPVIARLKLRTLFQLQQHSRESVMAAGAAPLQKHFQTAISQTAATHLFPAIPDR
jgi:hypothetical protein